MATYDLKPKDVTINLDMKTLLKINRERKVDHDKHKEGQKESVPKSDQDQSGKKTE